MTDRYLSVKSGEQGQSSSNIETFTFRVEPSSVPVFITKLCLMLDDNALCEMISWSNDGKRFCVFDIPGFSKVVLPQYFKHSNWPSFVRQLNMYGFHKVNDNFSARHGQLICEFHHPLFYRNGRLALRKIRRNSRKSVSNTGDSQTQHQSQHPSLQHHHQQQQQQQQQQQCYDRRCQKQSSPSYRPDASTISSSLPTSSLPISSLLSSNDNNYADDTTVAYLSSTTNNDTFGTDTKDDHHNSNNRNSIDGNNRIMTGTSNGNTMGNSNKTINIDNENSTDRNINISNDFGGYGDYCINKNKGKHTADIGNDYGDASQDNKNDGPNSIAPLAQQYTEIRQQLDQLQSNNTTANSEMTFLKRCVAKQQESVTNLLNYLSAIVEHSDHSGFKNQQKHQEALKALQVRSEQEFLDSSNGKMHIASDNNDNDSDKSHLYHHHHHYYHHHHHRNNEKYAGLDDATYFDDSNQTKKVTKNTLHKPKQSTESAKKDHHMHIHPLDNKESTTLEVLPLDNNKNDTHDSSRSNVNYSNNDDNGSSTTTDIKSPTPTTTELTSPKKMN